MDFMQSVKTVLKNYAKFDGRSGRAEFWWWVLAYIIGAILVTAVSRTLGMGDILTTVYGLALIVPNVAVSIRRFHDIGKQALWVILMFIPLVNLVVALIFLTKPSDGPNQYGEGPQPPAA
ncbi:DUF805 domain-containing protein [Hyphococcus luteus]|uniref:DUF805 domain-containing protein n=1 Tax=Hyphococcus luteus TaxID=2058213 RepID=A0A2S7K0V1_9PROT|nr:DUF805 domain-containing protein [Marinicaulis flavus]PQA86129.1 DUF805 domain-containing protein [Marinicaulis flavus]